MALIIFDLDGTLAKTNEDLADAVNSMRLSRGYQPLSLEKVTSLLGCGTFNLIKQALPELHSDEEVGQIIDDYLRAYDKCFTNKTHLYPGVQETLEKLSRHHTLAVFTNKRMYQAQKILDILGVAKFLQCIIGDNGGNIPLKPAGEAVLYVARQAASSLDGAWIVGDNWTDIQAGRNAGIRTCFCQYGFGDPRKVGADASITSFELLTKVIEQ